MSQELECLGWPGCRNRVIVKSLQYCSGHYAQHRKGSVLRPLRRSRTVEEILARDDAGRKKCVTCSQWKPESEYRRSVVGRDTDGFMATCSPCQRRKVNVRNRERKYGLNEQQFEALFDSQGRACAICRKPESKQPVGWAVDHDHACCKPKAQMCGKCVRGILCRQCNTALGHLEAPREWLDSALEYLMTTSSEYWQTGTPI